eukprot:CFRG7293T1
MAFNNPYDPYQQPNAPLAVSGYPTAPEPFGGPPQHRNPQQNGGAYPQWGAAPAPNTYQPGQGVPPQQQYQQPGYVQPGPQGYGQQYGAQGHGAHGGPSMNMGYNGMEKVPQMEEAGTCKLFVGNFPQGWTELELRNILAEHGQLTELTILLDRNTGASRGCAFATYTTKEAVERAHEALNGKKTIPGMSLPLKVKPATNRTEDANKLFVGLLDRAMTDADLKAMFVPYGEVEQVTVLRTPAGASRGCGFVLMSSVHESQAAIAALHESVTLPGNVYPMVVKFADTDKEKHRKKAQAMGAMVNQQNGWYGYPAVNGMYPGQQMGMGMPQYMPVPLGGADAGPEGGNLFIYHLPPDWTDAMLLQAFSPFGRIVSAKVFIDKSTGLSKGFGFVSYDNATSASAAIQSMNGYQVGNKRLKVQYKKPREQRSF